MTPPQQSPPFPLGWRRLTRYGQFAAHLVKARLRHKLLGGRRATADPQSIAFMGDLKGLPQKLGQHLSLKDHASFDLYSPLLVRGIPAPEATMRAVLQEALQNDLSHIATLHAPPLSSASIAQVYRAQLSPSLHPHTHAILKVQYPHIQRAIHDDMDSVQKLAEFISAFLPATSNLDPDALETILAGLRTEFLKEVDYTQELDNLHTFHRFLDKTPWATSPQPIARLCRPNVLAMTPVDGPLLLPTLQRAARNEQKRTLKRLVRLQLHSAFRLHRVQTDLHTGNLHAAGPANDPLRVIGLLDFGHVLQHPPSWWEALAAIIDRARADDPSQLAEEYETIGFDPKHLAPLKPILLPLSQILLRPFVERGPYNLKRWHLSQELHDLLEGGRKLKLTVPPELVMLQRVFYGLFFYVRFFNVKLDWYALLEEARSPESKHFPTLD